MNGDNDIKIWNVIFTDADSLNNLKTRLDNSTTIKTNANGSRRQILTEKKVAEYLGLSIIIKLGEHLPIHFHVKYGGEEATYLIQDCSPHKGTLKGNKNRHVLDWYRDKDHRQKLIETWNQSLTTDLSHLQITF